MNDTPYEQIATGLAIIATGVLLVVLIAVRVSWWWIGIPVGAGLVTLANGLAAWYAEREEDEEEPTDDDRDAVDELRSLYARGDVTEAEFERRLERLLETETVEGARETSEQSRSRERQTDPEQELGRE